MATKTEDKKIYEPTELEEVPLPEAIIWEEIVDKPTTLAELSPADGAALDAASTAITGLGALAYEDLVTALLIADGAVSNAKIAVDAIQGAVIAAGAITVTKISDGAIETGKLAANAVTAAKIAAGTITATQIAASTITASQIAAGTITTTQLNANAINGMTITGAILQTSTSGARVVIDGVDDDISIYDSSTLRARGYQQGWEYYNASSTLVGEIYASSSDFLILADITSGGSLYYGVGPSGSHSFHVGTTGDTIRLYLDDDEVWIGDVGNLGLDVQIFGQLRLNNGLYADMAGICSSSGVITNGGSEALTWSVSKSTGVYTITHNLGTANYIVLATPVAGSGAGAPGIKVQSKSSTDFVITTYNDAGSATDFQFYFMLILFN